MATLSNVLSAARAYAQTDSNGLTDANGIIFANEALLDFRGRLITEGIDAAQIQEATAAITTNTYLYPTNMWWLKAIELNYNGTVGQDYIRAQQIDKSNVPNGTSIGYLRSNASTAAPYFDDHGDYFEIFPTPTGTANARIFYYLEPTEYAATGDTIAYPESLNFRILAWRIAANYKRSLGDFDSAVSFDEEYTRMTKDLVDTLGRGVQTPIQAVTQQWSGFEF